MKAPWERFDEDLHAAAIERIDREIMRLALERTGARNGGLFLVDEDVKSLRIDFHVVEGLEVALPYMLLAKRTDGRPNGIAWWVVDHGEEYLTNDTSRDPTYAPYFLDVASIAAVPIRYQGRVIGVISVSSTRKSAFGKETLRELRAIAASAAKFLRRAQLHRATKDERGRGLLIKGLSKEWRAIEEIVERVAPTDAPVLLRGESGTGKELLANYIHFNSRRRTRPFVVVNCAAIPETLLESTLFGHTKGAFTGAAYEKVGELEKAHGGTAFLDEIGELAPSLQAKLLRALEGGDILPVGSNAAPRRVDVRVVCATNRDLDAMMRDGRFRDDLFYRVSTIMLDLPPLRTLRPNLPVLVQVFASQANARFGTAVDAIAPAALELLDAYDFPGNLRELRNIVDRAVLLADGHAIKPSHLPPHVRGGGSSEPGVRRGTYPALKRAWLTRFERGFVRERLREAGGRVAEAARRAGVNVVTFYRLMRRHGLRTATPGPG